MKAKAIAIAIVVAGMATACTEAINPIPEPNQVMYDTSPPPMPTPMLYLDVPGIGVSIMARPSKAYDLVEFNGHRNVVVGRTWWFTNDDSSLQANVCWYQQQDSIVMINGNIIGSTYIVNLKDSTMNICHGPQDLPISYDLLMNNSVNLPTR